MTQNLAQLLTLQEQADLVPRLVKNLHDTMPRLASTQFRMLLRALKGFNPDERQASNVPIVETVGIDPSSGEADYLSSKFTDLFNLDLSPLRGDPAGSGHRCPGLSAEAYTFLTDNSPMSINEASLLEFKKAAVKLLTTDAFSDKQKFVPLLIASHDSHLDVFRPAEHTFKRIKVDYEDASLIKQLYDLALGDDTRSGVRPVVKTHIIQVIAKSALGVNYRSSDDKPLVFELIKLAYEGSYSKGRQAAIELIRAMSRNGSDETVQQGASSLVALLQESIQSMGWPRQTSRDSTLSAIRRNAYESLGAILKRVPQYMDDLSVVKFLFTGLEEDTRDMKPSIQAALGEVLPSLSNLSEKSREELILQLIQLMQKSDADQVLKHTAIRFAVRSLPFSDPWGRAICLLGLRRDNRSDVIEEAKRGLHPYWYRIMNSTYGDKTGEQIEFPSFEAMYNVKHLFTSDEQLSFGVFDAAAVFMEQILVMNAVEGKKTVLVPDQDWDVRIDTAIGVDSVVRAAVTEHLQSMPTPLIVSFEQLLFDAIVGGHSAVDIPRVYTIWLRLLSLMHVERLAERDTERSGTTCEDGDGSPSKLAKIDSSDLWSQRLDKLWITTSKSSLNAATAVKVNEQLANAFGILASSPATPASTLQSLTQNIVTSSASPAKALCLGFLLSRCSFAQRLSDLDDATIKGAISSVVQPLISGDSAVLPNVLIRAVAQLSLAKLVSQDTVSALRERLVSLAHNDQQAVFAIGALSICDKPESGMDYVTALTELHSSKQPDYMFSSGEALTLAAAGWYSKLTDSFKDIQNGVYPYGTESEVSELLSKTFDNVIIHAKSPKPSLRKFACIWLMSLVKYCGSRPEAQERLSKIQVCFMRFLAERDDLIQQAASQGLSLVYESGGKDVKDKLVRDLVQSFTAENKFGLTSASVSEDTQLFEPGVLDTGDGSISTYKDILNLASEVGDPSLIYKFMSLAAHSSLWASRKGAAFGLGNILTKESLGLTFGEDNQLANTLIPKLYRYRFDPNSSVASAMKDIWDALIQDRSSEILNQYFKSILTELLKGMGHKEWRVRQASASAMSDLLHGRKIDTYEDHLETVLRAAFRVVDDIKESVRAAGVVLVRGLASALVRSIDTATGASEQKSANILGTLIPFLLGTTGLQSDSEDVRTFSLKILLDLSKKESPTLRSYIPQLIEEFLGMLSTLEPQAMNYLALNADKYGLDSGAVDASRMASLRSSPMMEAIELMIDRLDSEGLDVFIPRLTKVIKQSVGLPSKLGSSRVIVTLVLRNGYRLSPFADQLLVSSRSQLKDRNDVVVQSFAVACGYLSRSASNKTVVNYLGYLSDLYLKPASDDSRDKSKFVAAVGIQAFSAHASDKFGHLAASVLPLVFVGKHDEDNDIKQKFETVWSDNTGGIGAVRLYFAEITALVRDALQSQHWSVRQVAAKSIADAASAVGETVSTSDSLSDLFAVLMEASTGKSWQGKESVIKALVSVATLNKKQLDELPELGAKVRKTLVTEVKRRNMEYKASVIPYYADYVHSFGDEELYEVLFDSINSLDETDDTDAEGDKEMKTPTAIAKAEEGRVELYRAASASFNAESSMADKVLGKIVVLLERGLDAEKGTVTWRSKQAISQQFATLVDKVRIKNAALEALEPLWEAIYTSCAFDQNHEAVRTEAVRAGLRYYDSLGPSARTAVRTQLEKIEKCEKSSIVLTELRQGLAKSNAMDTA